MVFISKFLFIVSNYGSIGLSSWLNRIAKKEIGATFITTFVLIGHLGKVWSNSFWIFFSETKQYQLMAIIGWIYTIIFILINIKYMKKI